MGPMQIILSCVGIQSIEHKRKRVLIQACRLAHLSVCGVVILCRVAWRRGSSQITFGFLVTGWYNTPVTGIGQCQSTMNVACVQLPFKKLLYSKTKQQTHNKLTGKDSTTLYCVDRRPWEIFRNF